MPLIPNTVSVSTAPPRSVPNWMPITVITGISAFSEAVFHQRDLLALTLWRERFECTPHG